MTVQDVQTVPIVLNGAKRLNSLNDLNLKVEGAKHVLSEAKGT